MNMFSRKNRKGFTLIELIVVIAILAILAAIAIPSFIGITDNANEQVLRANASNIATAYNTDKALNPGKLADSYANWDALKGALDTNLLPKGLSDTEASAAWKYLSFSGGVADVLDKPAAAPAAGS